MIQTFNDNNNTKVTTLKKRKEKPNVAQVIFLTLKIYCAKSMLECF